MILKLKALGFFVSFSRRHENNRYEHRNCLTKKKEKKKNKNKKTNRAPPPTPKKFMFAFYVVSPTLTFTSRWGEYGN